MNLKPIKCFIKPMLRALLILAILQGLALVCAALLAQNLALSPLSVAITILGAALLAVGSALLLRRFIAVPSQNETDIAALLHMQQGSFRINEQAGIVSLSPSLFKILRLTPPVDDSNTISLKAWRDIFKTWEQKSLLEQEDGVCEELYAVDGAEGGQKWFRLRWVKQRSELGMITDVTEEIVSKQHLEFERDRDPLTKLFNRQAFVNKAGELLKSAPNTVGLMMFADIDDLKLVNDLYGHESGDEYIKVFASFLNHFTEQGAVVGRISGDEFVLFMNGFSSRVKAKTFFDNVFWQLNNLSITTPGNTIHRMRASVGLCYYPDNAISIKQLIKYADFAMYEIKHTVKGGMREFDKTSYNKNSSVINMKNILRVFIEEKRLRFAFQPIVSTATGKTFAYEVLMRPMLRELCSPEDIINMARSQSKLYQIEKLVINGVFEWMEQHTEFIADKKIFVNSIPNQLFTKNDLGSICGKYGHLFKYMVFEITESEFSEDKPTKKIASYKSFGAQVAIDNYGSGYANEASLLQLSPDFLKLDSSMVRGINKDAGKQQLVHNMIAKAAKKKIKTIAVGVETADEMSTLLRLGVDYLQGYYLGHPEFDPVLVNMPHLKK